MYHEAVKTQAPKTARAAQAERTRRAVLDAARRLFAEQGFAATSLQQIADAMGVRKANVYYYFRSKAALLEALLDERIEALETMLDAAEQEPDRRQRLDLMIDGFVAQVVTAHREIAPVDFADPGVRALPGVSEKLAALAARATGLLFGPSPTADELAALALVQDLKPVLRALTRLPDEELRAALRRLCRRLLP